MRQAPLPYARRVAIWDAALSVVRDHLRREGLREVSTPVRVVAPAIEPYIDPIAAPPGYLATSPELAMKRLLARGSGPIFQVSHVFRRAERGDRHCEEFHLLEWYRLGGDLRALQADVEALVAAVFVAIGGEPPRYWLRVDFFAIFEQTCGIVLRGDEDDAELKETLDPHLRALVWDEARGSQPGPLCSSDPQVRQLAAWTTLFSVWSDLHLDPWLAEQVGVGVHLCNFPGALAALAQRGQAGERVVAHRLESHVASVELANGYLELRDPHEQRRRFLAVDALREALGQGSLPLDEDFLRELGEPGLPLCTGMALGLDRLIMLACGRTRLADISLALGAA